MDEYKMEELDNKKDFDIEYNPFMTVVLDDENITIVKSKSFVSTLGWDSNPNNDVYDFREMYVTPSDIDAYSIPKVLAPMPQKVSYVDRFVAILAVKHDCVFGDDLDLNEISYMFEFLNELKHPTVYSLSPRTNVTPAMTKDVNGLFNV
ncbi:hypothetical protein JHK87_018162 [Glycine soja]|nr:hypothetical protein JHK87_018162 [Glycine soja]